MKVKTLILGAGISGISLAHFLENRHDTDYVVLEKDIIAGGLCRSFKINEFTFDYSGHFLHFKNAEMKKYIEMLLAQLALEQNHEIEFKEFERKAAILLSLAGQQFLVDYPFQANIHQLPMNTFLECLIDKWESPTVVGKENNFGDMVKHTFGNKITELFFRPYNEKLYRTKLEDLDADAMKRFIPTVSFSQMMSNFKSEKQFGYNSAFLYSPKTGIQGLIDAFRPEKLKIRYAEDVMLIDLKNQIVETNNETYFYDTLVNTLPLNVFCNLAGIHVDFKHVIVDVYNLGFNKKENVSNVCWMYIPDKHYSFYRVGFYDYMSKINKTSLYVEVSRLPGEDIKETAQIVSELKDAKIISEDAKLIAEQVLTMNPAYVILEKDTDSVVSKISEHLFTKHNTHLLGRYGKWTYQSIEDNILDAKALSEKQR
jgi:protoporphyrinogen oxidase